MASPAALYFAGIGTVVGAISLGFAGAMVLTSTQPVHKEPAAAFAKRNLPVEAPAPAPPAAAAPGSETTGQAPVRTAASDIVPATTTKVEEVVGLHYAPPSPQAIDTPAPRTIAPDSMPTQVAATAVEPAVKPAKPARDEAKGRSERKIKKEKQPSTAIAETKEPGRKQYAERRKRRIEMSDDDGEPMHTSFAPERRSRGGDGEGFFSFLFGN
jgi:hypothetical protein